MHGARGVNGVDGANSCGSLHDEENNTEETLMGKEFWSCK